MFQSWMIRIGQSGKFDETFALAKYHHPALMEPLYIIVWIDSEEQVIGTGGFIDPISAEDYVKDNRNKLIDKEFEKILLVNE